MTFCFALGFVNSCIEMAGTKIVTQLVEAGPWWDAEDYHQEYLFKNPSGYQCPTHRLHW